MEDTLDVFQYDFVDILPLKFVCPVCKDVIHNPQVVLCCKEHICEGCIKKLKADKKQCPTCNNKKFSIKSDPSFKKLLDAQEIHCTNKVNGCLWSGPLGNLDDHLNSQSDSCSYANSSSVAMATHRKMRRQISSSNGVDIVFCPCYAVGCNTTISKDDISSHMNGSIKEHVQLITGYAQQLQEREKDIKESEAELERKTEILIIKELANAEKETEANDTRRKLEELQVLVEAKNNEIIDLCDEISKLKKRGQQPDSQYIQPIPNSNVFSYRFIMSNFSQYCHGAGGKLCWGSDSFYTHDEGYKMSFVVDVVLNSLRVSLCILPGTFDDNLSWPLQGSITISLLNQLENYNHYSYKFVYDESTQYSVANRVTGRGNKHVSTSHKLTCDDLPFSPSKNLCYLKNNILMFTVSHIDLIL